MQKRYPFKFLDAYTRDDKDIFFGREAEVEALYEMIYQADLILIYGISGTGKSSLIQCGLASKFQNHAWLPLPVRRGTDLNASLRKALEEAGGIITDGDDDLTWFESEGSDTLAQVSPLSQQFKAVYLRHFRPIYLIFDQFEELYILGTAAEQKQFIQTIQEILRLDQPIKIIFSIREEYLGYLYEFEKAIPELLRKKLRIEPMNLDKIRMVMQGLRQLPQSLVQLPPNEATLNDLAEQIFDKIKGDGKSLSIQLPYLQVFLDEFYMKLSGDAQRQTEVYFDLEALDQMGSIGDVLADFLNEQVRQIALEREIKEDPIWEILSPFVTLEGTKEPLRLSELMRRLPHLLPTLIRDCLQALVQRRILRLLEEEELYEVAHDSLARQITNKRSDEQMAIMEVQRLVKTSSYAQEDVREYFSERQLGFIEPYLKKFMPDGQERDWIEQSKAHHRARREEEKKQQARELEEAKAQMEKEAGLRQEAQQSARKAKTRQVIAFGLLFLALIVTAGAVYYYVEAQTQTRQAKEAVARFYVEKARTTLTLIRNFRNLGEKSIANENLKLVRQYVDSIKIYDRKKSEIKEINQKIIELENED
ncbi:MAG: ATP-binding protein [Bacteroidota bacterium]